MAHGIDYQLIEQVYHVKAILSEGATDRRLREVRDCEYRQDPRVVALQRVLSKKSGMSATELRILREFPPEGLALGGHSMSGTISLALIFADALRRKPISWHKAVVSLVKQRCLMIAEGPCTDCQDRREILVRV